MRNIPKLVRGAGPENKNRLPNGWLRTSPGVYSDEAGAMHINEKELLEGAGYVDTPENRATLRQVFREAAERMGVGFHIVDD